MQMQMMRPRASAGERLKLPPSQEGQVDANACVPAFWRRPSPRCYRDDGLGVLRLTGGPRAGARSSFACPGVAGSSLPS